MTPWLLKVVDSAHQSYARWCIATLPRLPWIRFASTYRFVERVRVLQQDAIYYYGEAAKLSLAASTFMWRFPLHDIERLKTVVSLAGLDRESSISGTLARNELNEKHLFRDIGFYSRLTVLFSKTPPFSMPGVSRHEPRLSDKIDRIAFHIDRKFSDHVMLRADCYYSDIAVQDYVSRLESHYVARPRFRFWAPWNLAKSISIEPDNEVRKREVERSVTELERLVVARLNRVTDNQLGEPSFAIRVYDFETPHERIAEAVPRYRPLLDAASLRGFPPIFSDDGGVALCRMDKPGHLGVSEYAIIAYHSNALSRESDESEDKIDRALMILGWAGALSHFLFQSRVAIDKLASQLRASLVGPGGLTRLARCAADAVRATSDAGDGFVEPDELSWRFGDLKRYRNIGPGLSDTLFDAVVGSWATENVRLRNRAKALSEAAQGILNARNVAASFQLQAWILIIGGIGTLLGAVGIAIASSEVIRKEFGKVLERLLNL